MEHQAVPVPIGDIRLPVDVTVNRTGIEYARLRRSIDTHGLYVPILVRRAPLWFVQRARINHRWTWLVLCRELIGDGTYAGTIKRYPTEDQAKAALPPDVPYEVVPGHGLKRFAVAIECKLTRIPAVYVDAAAVATLGRVSPGDTQG